MDSHDRFRMTNWLVSRQISLRSLLLFVVLPAFMANHARITLLQQRAVTTIERLGGSIYYDYEIDDRCRFDPNRRSWIPDWMIDRFGRDWAHSVAVVNLATRTEGGRRVRNELSNDDAMDPLSAFPHLRALVATQSQVTDRGMERIGRLTRLETLYISDAREITDAGVQHLRRLGRLRSLHLTHASLTDESFEFVRSLPELRVLSIRGNRLSEQAFSNLASLRHLESLEFGMAQFEVSNDALMQLEELERLRYLQIVSVPLTNDAIDCFGSFVHLQQLCLEDTQITDLTRLQAVLPNCRIQLHSVASNDATHTAWLQSRQSPPMAGSFESYLYAK